MRPHGVRSVALNSTLPVRQCLPWSVGENFEGVAFLGRCGGCWSVQRINWSPTWSVQGSI